MSEQEKTGSLDDKFIQIQGSEFVIKFAGQIDAAIQKRLNDQFVELLKQEFPNLYPSRFKIPIHGWNGMIVSPSRDLDIQIPSGVEIRFKIR